MSMEAYKISVSLNLVNGLSGPLGLIMADFTKLQKLSIATNKSFADLGKNVAGINKLAQSVQNLNNQLSNTIKRAERAAAAMGGMGAQTFGVGASNQTQSSGPRSRATQPFYAPASIYANRMGGSGSSGGYDGGLPPFYTQSTLGGSSQRRIGYDGGALEGNFTRGENFRFSEYGNNPTGIQGRPPLISGPQQGSRDPYGSMFAGGMLMGAGESILMGPYEEAKKLYQAQSNIKTLNLSHADNARINKKAFDLSQQLPGSTITGNTSALQDLHTAFGSLPHALEMAKNFQAFALAAEMKEGRPVEGLIYNAAKALEHRGGRLTNSPEAFGSELDMMSKVYFGSKGKVSPSDYFSASQTGKMAYKMFSPEFLYGPYASYIQEKTGMTAGTASMTAFSSLIGGHMDSKAKGFLADLGGGIYEEGLSASRVNLMKKAMRDAGIKEGDPDYKTLAPTSGGLNPNLAELFAANPDKFTNEILIPAIQKKYGLDANIPLLLSKHFNRNTGDFLSEWFINKSKNEKDARIFQKSTGFQSAYELYQKSPQGAELAASAAWKNFLALFGTVYLPQITKGLTSLANVLTKLSKWSQDNPIIFKALVYGLTGLGIAATVAGGVLLLGGAIGIIGSALGGGVVASGLGLVASALGVLGKATVAFGAAYAGYKAGEYIGNQLPSSVQDTIGTMGTKALAALGYQPAIDSIASDKAYSARHVSNVIPFNPIAPKNKQNINVTSILRVDGKDMAKNVTKHQSISASAPFMGIGSFDPTMNLAPVGMK